MLFDKSVVYPWSLAGCASQMQDSRECTNVGSSLWLRSLRVRIYRLCSTDRQTGRQAARQTDCALQLDCWFQYSAQERDAQFIERSSEVQWSQNTLKTNQIPCLFLICSPLLCFLDMSHMNITYKYHIWISHMNIWINHCIPFINWLCTGWLSHRLCCTDMDGRADGQTARLCPFPVTYSSWDSTWAGIHFSQHQRRGRRRRQERDKEKKKKRRK